VGAGEGQDRGPFTDAEVFMMRGVVEVQELKHEIALAEEDLEKQEHKLMDLEHTLARQRQEKEQEEEDAAAAAAVAEEEEKKGGALRRYSFS